MPSAAVVAAQAAVVNHGSNVWAGVNMDAISGSTCSSSPCRQGDDTHLSVAGATTLSPAMVTAMGLAGAPFLYQPAWAANDNWSAVDGCNDNTMDLCKAM